ncbi:MAG: NAD-dependent deacylase [Bacteroidota bacterium]|nr:NAD-dependent deacylase [Bacteroidota bacterium]
MVCSEQDIIKAAGWIVNAKHPVAFTGAGISVESGIPPFRGEGGVWSKHDPSILDIDYFCKHPSESWKAIAEIFYHYIMDASPNAAHYLLARMEKEGLLKSVITQNIDNMHQEAGSREVIEYHGNSKWLKCSQCGERYEVSGVKLDPLPPRCSNDQEVLKPDFVFFGEGIPPEAASKSVEEVSRADLLLIIGTTGEVMPAGMLPSKARSHGARIIEINPSNSAFTESMTDLFLQGPAAELSKLMDSYLF